MVTTSGGSGGVPGKLPRQFSTGLPVGNTKPKKKKKKGKGKKK
jgi:hypothetical protein